MRKRGGAWRWARRTLLAAAAVVAVLALGLLGMFGYLQAQSRRGVTLPAPTGRYQVGRAIYDWTDASRADPFSPSGRSPRELSVWAWYPARVPAGARRAAYLPPDWQAAVQGADFLHTRADAITTHSWDDAPLANAAGRSPVLVLMPGFGRVAADYTTLAEDLASHGYVVLGINPTYLSDDVVLRGGRTVAANRKVAEQIDGDSDRESIAESVIEVEAADMRFALGRADALDRTPGQRFAGRLDTTRVGLLGHSIGGAAAARGCELEPRCAGAVNIDGTMAGPVLASGVGRPFLFLAEDPSSSAVPASQLRDAMRDVPAGRGWTLTVAGTGHMNFSDVSVLYKFPPGQLGVIGPIGGARAVAITRACVGAFLAATLQGRPAPLLRGASRGYPEVRPVPGFS